MDDQKQDGFSYVAEFARNWFQWLEWITIAAALHAFGEKSGNVVVKAIAVVSLLAVSGYTYLALERYAERILPSPSTLSRLAFRVLVGVLVAAQFVSLYFISTVIGTLLK